jgi:hypothetical protein
MIIDINISYKLVKWVLLSINNLEYTIQAHIYMYLKILITKYIILYKLI